MSDRSKYIWYNNKITDWDNANIHVMSHVIHYGSGVFEGIKCYNTSNGPAIFRLEEHMNRLHESAKAYQIKIPYSSIFYNKLFAVFDFNNDGSINK